MDDVTAILAILGGLITLITIVAAAVWAVAQIKEATSNLAIEIRNLSRAVDKMGDDFEEMEKRLRAVEGRH